MGGSKFGDAGMLPNAGGGGDVEKTLETDVNNKKNDVGSESHTMTDVHAYTHYCVMVLRRWRPDRRTAGREKSRALPHRVSRRARRRGLVPPSLQVLIPQSRERHARELEPPLIDVH